MKEFPKGFLWGASTSAHQVEGGNRNDWTEWEKKNAERLAREAKNYWEPWQHEKFPEMFNPENYISGRVADHYNRYEEDFDLMKELGMNAYRFSIEWSRIEPEEGKFDEKEIEHYRKVIAALKGRGIEPFVALFHFSSPAWFRDKGGWGSKGAPERFERFVRYIVEELNDQVGFWIPLNEPVIYALMGALRIGPWLGWPYTKTGYYNWFRIVGNFVRAHKSAYVAIKKVDSGNSVGVAKSYVYFDACNRNPVSKIVAKLARHFHSERFLKKVRRHLDFVGINYYAHNRVRVGFSRPEKWFNHNEYKSVTDLGWEIYPEGLYHSLMRTSRLDKPIYVMENGIADAEDSKRAEFIRGHLEWTHRAVEDGVDVRGYLHWSLLDNFEWADGFWPRFGLVEVDYKTQKRTVRGSAKEYAKIMHANALE